MAAYAYTGRNAAGDMVEGVLDAGSASLAADALFGAGVTPLTIEERIGGMALSQPLEFRLFAPRIGHIETLLFTRQLYTLLKAGVPIMRALSGLEESNTNVAMKNMLRSLRESLDQGRELSVAMARHPKVFSPFYLAMVRVGEMTGRLEEVFLRLFHHMSFERFMHEQVKSALRYPMFVVIAMLVALIVVNILVIPQFAAVFRGFGAELPLMTRILIGFSDFFVNWWPLLLLVTVAAVITFWRWINTPAGRYRWDAFKLRLPVAGKIVRKATLARFARSFALAARSGVPVIQGLSTVAMTVDNDWISEKVERMRDGVERGESILRAAIGTGAFTPVVLQMIAVGEESGAIDELMEEIADMYQNEVEYELKTLAQQIEPILIVMLGALVLVLALGIFLPLWDLGRVALKK